MVYHDELKTRAEKIFEDYAVGTVLIEGDNRFLSGDLIEFLYWLLGDDRKQKLTQRMFNKVAKKTKLEPFSFYAPGSKYNSGQVCTLLRNPHIARNEEVQLRVHTELKKIDALRSLYLHHLTDVVMIDPTVLAAERLGGADYDGDMIRTISDPLVNECVSRNYSNADLDHRSNIPLLKIPSAEPQIRNADDWIACFETIRNTFSSRIGQISNAALDRSLIAYNENSTAEEREHRRKEVETLANEFPHISSTSSKPCITSAIMRVARMNPELNASRSVMEDSSLVQSLNFSKVSFCFSVSPELSSSSFLHISLTSLSTFVPRLMYLSCGLMLPFFVVDIGRHLKFMYGTATCRPSFLS